MISCILKYHNKFEQCYHFFFTVFFNQRVSHTSLSHVVVDVRKVETRRVPDVTTYPRATKCQSLPTASMRLVKVNWHIIYFKVIKKIWSINAASTSLVVSGQNGPHTRSYSITSSHFSYWSDVNYRQSWKFYVKIQPGNSNSKQFFSAVLRRF